MVNIPTEKLHIFSTPPPKSLATKNAHATPRSLLAEDSEVPNGGEEENHSEPQWWLDVYHRQLDIHTPKS